MALGQSWHRQEGKDRALRRRLGTRPAWWSKATSERLVLLVWSPFGGNISCLVAFTKFLYHYFSSVFMHGINVYKSLPIANRDDKSNEINRLKLQLKSR